MGGKDRGRSHSGMGGKKAQNSWSDALEGDGCFTVWPKTGAAGNQNTLHLGDSNWLPFFVP